MKYLLAILTILFILPFCANAQLIKIENHTAFVNDEPYLIIKKKGCQTIGAPCAYEIYTLDKRKIALATSKKQNKTAEQLKQSPNAYYVEYNFYEPDDLSCQTPFPLSVTLHPSDVVKQLYDAGIVWENEIEEEALLDFIDTYGSTFSTVQSEGGIEGRLKSKSDKKKKQTDESTEDDEDEH